MSLAVGKPPRVPRNSRNPNVKPGLETRQAAAKLLAAVIDRHVSLDGLLDPENGNPAYRALGEADKALARAILVTALRHLPVIDAFLGELLEKPLPEGARALHHALVVAATQVLYLDIPNRAAVDLAVEQARSDPRSRRFANLANAVLRRMARERKETLPRLAETIVCAPTWFADRLRKIYGYAHSAAILRAHQHEGPIDLTVKYDPHAWADRLGGVVLPTGSVRLCAIDGPVTALPGFAEGEWWVQDAAASIPARLFGDIAGKSIADLCAAPGGKTAQLALEGGDVTAFDLSANRLRRLAGNLGRLRLPARCVEGDFMKVAPEAAFDAVLLDAPCSSTGTVRRHPDVPWTKGPDDIAKLAALQEKMLRRAALLVKPGGRIVFSNCSLDPMEGEEVVARVLAEVPWLNLSPVDPARWPGLEGTVSEKTGAIRTTPAMLPHAEPRLAGLDGFYAAAVIRQA